MRSRGWDDGRTEEGVNDGDFARIHIMTHTHHITPINSYNSHQHQLYQHIIIIMSTDSSSTMASPTTGTSTFSSLFSYSSSSSTKTPHAPSNNKQLGIKAVDGTAKSNNEELKSFCAQWMML